MAFTGNSDANQLITVPDFHWFRGRSRFSIAAWVRIVSFSYWRPFWRQDGVFTPVQIHGGESVLIAPLWTPSLVNVNGSLVGYGAPAFNEWSFCVFTWSAERGALAYRYTEAGGLYTNPNNLFAGSSITSTPSEIKPMVFGGVEYTGDDAMLSGEAIAECAVFPSLIAPSQIPDLAHDLSAFRDQMVFYAPFRDAGRRSTEEVGKGRAYRIQYGTATRALILPEDHPPVERMRWGRRHFVAAAPSADVAGSVALSLTATGSIAVAKPVSGSVAVALATSGSIAVAKPVAGGVGLALSATGAIAVNKPVAGSVAMGVACSGALAIPKPVAGSVAVGLTAAGSVAVAKPVSGAVAVALTTSGALTTVGMGGAVAVSVATAGSVAVAKPVSGAVLVSLTTAAALTIAKPVSGNVALSLVTSGSVQVAKPVAGAVSVALTAAGAVQVPKLLGGAVSVSLTAGGSVAVAKPVGGAVVLSLTTTGRIETATLRGLVTAVLTLRSPPTTLTLRPTDATLTTRAGSAALTLRPAADAALQFQTDDPV